MKNNISLSDHFTYGRLFRFVLPSIGMMIFTSIYGVVDGYFVSNFAGKTQFAAINLIWPFLMMFSAIGFMIGAGGTALVSMYLGRGEKKHANSVFSLLVYTVIVLGLIFTALGIVVLKDVSRLLGATETMLPFCVRYGRIILMSMVPFMLQNLFQSFLVTAEKPKLGFAVTVLAGITNMALDFLLVKVLELGVDGAATATAVSQCVGGIIPLIYFVLPNKSLLRLGKTKFEIGAILKASGNGASEFLSNISMSTVGMAYNFQLLKYAGENGVSVYGVIMYVCFVFISVYIGYSIGVAPVIGYNYGANNKKELKSVHKKSLVFMVVFAAAMFLSSELLARPLAKLYVGYSRELFDLTVPAFKIYSISFLIMGFNIFASSFFTALNNGTVSAVISVSRTLVFQILAVLVLPSMFGFIGIFWANTFAELLSLFVTLTFKITMRKKYGY